MVAPTDTQPDAPASRGKLRWILGWIVLPVLVIGSLFLFGVHVGARHPDMGLSRLLLWLFDAEPGVRAGPPRPPTEPPGPQISPDGNWIVGDFEIHMKSPPGAWLSLYGPKQGLTLGIGEPASETAFTRIKIEPVEGFARELLLEDRLTPWLFEGIDVEWVTQPGELRPGVSSWHMRGTTEAGELVDIVEFAFVVPRARSLLLCGVVIIGPEHRRMDELIDQCKHLDWSIADDRSPPSEARIAGHYVVDGLDFAIPDPPPGFVFHHYMPGKQVDFIRSGRKLDSSHFLIMACGEDCERAVVAQSLEAIAENRWRGRERRSDRLLGEIIAKRPGTDSYIWCFFELEAADMNREDELDALCLELLANY